MKRFIRTLTGKTILFILCILSACILAASVVGIVIYTQDDLGFYLSSEQDLSDKYIGDQIRSYGYQILWDELSEPAETQSYDFNYRITDEKNKVVSESAGFKNGEATSYTISYGILRDKKGNVTDIYYHGPNEATDDSADYYTVVLSPVKGTSVAAEIGFMTSVFHLMYSLRYAVYFIALVSLLAMIGSFVALMYASGRRPDTEKTYPGPLHKIPYDLLFAVCALFGIGLIYAVDSNINGIATIIAALAVSLLGLIIGLGLCMSAAGRIKQRTFLKNTVIYRILYLLWQILGFVWTLLKRLHSFNCSLFKGLPLVWKTGLIAFGTAFLELTVILTNSHDTGNMALFWFFEKLILIPALLYLALTLRKLQKAGIALAGGDLSYHTNTKGMIWDFKQHGENLNSIAGGMAIAVEDRMKSERMKTELITNVSHDIKTPLTSIINYASLIGSETCDNPKITEYSEVLVRQSEKLKRLIEDLVEASKASTGNLDVLLAPCDASVFISQAAGEYEEKLLNSELTLVTSQPDKDLLIMADGRRMWRVFDNLMNNICKYAQPGTRVYLSLEEKGGNAIISFKNTSRDPLNIPAEELMERFFRGDISRNTEGNGLGLSIAKSMAELQGGDLDISIDGDLFKATLTFPLI